MDKDKVRKTVDYIKSCKPYTAFSMAEFEILVELAEQWLAVSGKMPDKISIIKELSFDETCVKVVEAINSTIDQCTLAFTGMEPHLKWKESLDLANEKIAKLELALLSVEEIVKIIQNCKHPHITEVNRYTIAQAIHQAQQDKLEGK